ncbi:MAG: four-carbon acid sugar kinase family protein [Cytobacillus gottheilii]|uniref:four-carbon acid sugar kinase family protein n=1 Tax=Cytobacillus gottheilii TaxID=859144 RepID=UPI003464294E
MVKLLIIADDFTGALDTGIQFTEKGISTQVFNNFNFKTDEIPSNTEVLVIDTESRPLSKEAAYESVRKISDWAREQGIEMIFKKTDSALRGNIGSELQAVCDSYPDDTLFFIPAHPEIDRVIKEGTSYISGQLLEHSVFGNDPFEPVTKSFIPDIIKDQSDIAVDVITSEEAIDWDTINQTSILVCDSSTVDDIDKRLNELMQNNTVKYFAGCTALADRLANILSFNRTETASYRKTEGLYIACGSLNKITGKQLDYAEKHGFNRKRLTLRQKSPMNYFNSPEGKTFIQELLEISQENNKVIVDTFEDVINENEKDNKPQESLRFAIAEAHGHLAEEIMNSEKDCTILMTGGDTLMGFLNVIGSTQIKLLCEIEKGAVLSIIEHNGKKQQVISKSGGFGTEDVFCRIADKILK